MQKKHLIGAGITAFSVILGLLWLPTYLADRNRIFCSILPYDTVPNNSVYTGQY